LRFAGQYYDGETELHYNWWRYYDPKIGRYLRPDPIGFNGGDENLYAYVWNDPNYWVDPSGEFAQIAIGFVSGFVTDVLWQVFIDGHDLSCISYKRALIAGATDAVGVGLLKVLSRVRKIYKISKASKVIKLLDSQKRHFNKIENIITNHAKPHDFTGVMKELAGKPTGWDHIQEMRSSVNGLKRSIRALKGSLQDPTHNAATRKIVQQKIDEASEVLRRMKDALGR
jgi:RHS repeat-associated protein